MTAIIFDPAAFRIMFPAFANETAYPDPLLQGWFDMATCYVSADGCPCCGSPAACTTTPLYLMTAHLGALADIVKTGQVPGMVQATSIDKISVTLTSPPLTDQWSWWLGLTPYGQQLLALFMVQSAGGFLFGGVPELGAFRRVGGYYIP